MSDGHKVPIAFDKNYITRSIFNFYEAITWQFSKHIYIFIYLYLSFSGVVPTWHKVELYTFLFCFVFFVLFVLCVCESYFIKWQ